MNKRIILLKAENEAVYNPLGLLYIGSYLKGRGYDPRLEIIPAGFFTDPSAVERKAAEIANGGYLFAGFSVLTGPQTEFSALLSKRIKAHNNRMPVVWGGIHPSLAFEQTLREPYIDIVVIGEGEKTVFELAEAMNGGRDIAQVDGIGYKRGHELLFTGERALMKDLDEVELDWSLIDMEKCLFEVQGRRIKGFIYLTSRGCPYDCSFCYNKTFSKRRWRVHSIERIVKDIRRLKEAYAVETVAFMDDHFFVNRTRAFEILSSLKNMGISCAEFLLRVDEITGDTLDRLDELGVKRLFIGVESGSDRILELMNKNTTRAMIIEKFRLLARHRKIAVNSAMIIGYPTETLKEIEETIDLGIELSGMIPGIVVTFQTFLPYPGTEAYRLAVKEGFSPPQKTEDYRIYDTFGTSMPLSWLPWADDGTRELFFRIDKYGKLLTHSPSTSFLRTCGKLFLYELAKFRLRHRFFAFSFEIPVLFRFNRYYNPACRI